MLQVLFRQEVFFTFLSHIVSQWEGVALALTCGRWVALGLNHGRVGFDRVGREVVLGFDHGREVALGFNNGEVTLGFNHYGGVLWVSTIGGRVLTMGRGWVFAKKAAPLYKQSNLKAIWYRGIQSPHNYF